MRNLVVPAAAFGLLLLAACGGSQADAGADNYGATAEPAAANLEQSAEDAAKEAAEDSRRLQAAAGNTGGNDVD